MQGMQEIISLQMSKREVGVKMCSLQGWLNRWREEVFTDWAAAIARNTKIKPNNGRVLPGMRKKRC